MTRQLPAGRRKLVLRFAESAGYQVLHTAALKQQLHRLLLLQVSCDIHASAAECGRGPEPWQHRQLCAREVRGPDGGKVKRVTPSVRSDGAGTCGFMQNNER